VTSYSESELAYLSIEQAARLLRRGEISPVDLVEASLARIERWSPQLNVFLTVLAENARRQAKVAEREIHRGRVKSPLHGIPVSLKDNFATRGVRTTAGSKILADWVPQDDSAVAKRLARAGAILLGKTNMHEFAYGITGENPHYGSSRNPWAPARISGGSSGGSVVAVALGMGAASVGTDTGGSIRVPAALCGMVGLKPTHGLVSTEGVVPLGVSFDHCGPIARNVTDACIVLETIAGRFPRGAVRPRWRALGKILPRRIRIGVPKQYYFDRLEAQVRGSVEAGAKKFQSLGARVEQVSLPRMAAAVEQATNMIVAEASAYHESQGYFPARAAEYGDDVRGHLEFGHKLLAMDYFRGMAARREVIEDLQAAFEKADVILGPTAPISAPLIGQTQVRVSGERETATRAELLRLTRPGNISGMPAISIPCGFTREGLPVGMQLLGPPWSEARLLAIARAYEQATQWHTRRPNLADRESEIA
jgi:aspartyl-tRNA(Asn)/glutamyl-tRNA(Gln) amidotransferase subunit A